VPVGATEQHGPHLPLTTDTDIAVALAAGLAAEAPDDVVIAPAVAYGSSGEHQDFPGTLSIGAPAIELLLVELGRSATCTWPRVLLISTHGGNAAAVARAAWLLRNEGRDVRAWLPTWRGDAHAGHTETSIMATLAPERVDFQLAAVGATEPLAELLPRLRRDGVAPVSASGILGDATTADAAHGAELLDAAIAALATLIRDWQAS
jgi:creatinine amidohydrolase